MARPPRNEKAATHLVAFRLTESERSALHRLVSSGRYGDSPSTVLRSLIREAAAEPNENAVSIVPQTTADSASADLTLARKAAAKQAERRFRRAALAALPILADVLPRPTELEPYADITSIGDFETQARIRKYLGWDKPFDGSAQEYDELTALVEAARRA